MRELKIFLVLVIFTGIVYFGVEPYAHSQMHEQVSHANFDYEQEDKSFSQLRRQKAQQALEIAKQAAQQNPSDEKLQKELQSANDMAEYLANEAKAIDLMWANANIVMGKTGDATSGEEKFDELGCSGCHKLSIDGKVDAGYAVNTTGFINPDLSLAGKIYDEKFLAALVLNPALAMKNNHKFNDDNPHPMSALALEDEEGKINDEEAQSVADLIAYLKQAASKSVAKYEQDAKAIMADKKIQDQATIDGFVKFYQNKQVFLNACARCHDMRYDGLNNHNVDKDAFSKYQESGEGDHMLEYAKVMYEKDEDNNESGLMHYMGSMPPDLSIIIRARSHEYLNDFINNTQKLLPNTAMPRVGLNEQSQKELMEYLADVGDSKRIERKDLGVKIMIYFAILAVFAWLWKTSVWRKLH